MGWRDPRVIIKYGPFIGLVKKLALLFKPLRQARAERCQDRLDVLWGKADDGVSRDDDHAAPQPASIISYYSIIRMKGF